MNENHLERSLGVGTLTFTCVGLAVGAGIFVVTGQTAEAYAGPLILLLL